MQAALSGFLLYQNSPTFTHNLNDALPGSPRLMHGRIDGNTIAIQPECMAQRAKQSSDASK